MAELFSPPWLQEAIKNLGVAEGPGAAEFRARRTNGR